ncbi:hypothetical protein EVJ58_g5198 [Rhodofomes roseus]|uniref:Uncharacterized protein n=1 Tax=Rhodofomes roseus TaxID=34475 RepID=A0A4Y9YG03_9APHY|nr:hypothetical protein EVJ58_g5198 [Rhodofomes roseus]
MFHSRGQLHQDWFNLVLHTLKGNKCKCQKSFVAAEESPMHKKDKKWCLTEKSENSQAINGHHQEEQGELAPPRAISNLENLHPSKVRIGKEKVIEQASSGNHAHADTQSMAEHIAC